MKIELNDKQYFALVKMAYMANWMTGSMEQGNDNRDIEELEQYIYSVANEFNSEHLIENKEQNNLLGPIAAFEETMDVFIEAYENFVFWQKLPLYLAERDLHKNYDVEKMYADERFQELVTYEEAYRKEFVESGLMNLMLKKEDSKG